MDRRYAGTFFAGLRRRIFREPVSGSRLQGTMRRFPRGFRSPLSEPAESSAVGGGSGAQRSDGGHVLKVGFVIFTTTQRKITSKV